MSGNEYAPPRGREVAIGRSETQEVAGTAAAGGIALTNSLGALSGWLGPTVEVRLCARRRHWTLLRCRRRYLRKRTLSGAYKTQARRTTSHVRYVDTVTHICRGAEKREQHSAPGTAC